MNNLQTLTPLMQQYISIKEKYKEEIVFFQVGDFYELFFEDAKLAASILAITLTKRGVMNGEHIPLCGVPVHMIDHYIPKLIKKGYIVIICDQKETAQPGKLVNRAITQIITPSTLLNDESHEHIYSLFILIHENIITAFWFEFGKQEIVYSQSNNIVFGIVEFKSLLEKYKPKEIITNAENIENIYDIISYKKNIKTFIIDEEINYILFLEKYNLNNLFIPLIKLFLSYLKKYFENLINHNYFILKKINIDEHVFLDNSTIRYLECVSNLYDDTKDNTLYHILDKTKTKMASRLLKDWILNPLANIKKINERQNIINYILSLNTSFREEIHDYIALFGDLERFFQKFRLQKIKNKDLIQLFNFQKNYLLFLSFIKNNNFPELQALINFSIPLDILDIISKTIIIDESIIIENNIHYINPRIDSYLLSLYESFTNQEKILLDFCQKEKQKTGISELTIKKTPLYNYVFELSKLKDKKYEIPTHYKRIQTLANKERYISHELQDFSYHLIYAQDNYILRENEIKEKFINKIHSHLHYIFQFIESIKTVDVYFSLAHCAYLYKWKKPTIIDLNNDLKIVEGKHPVISTISQTYIANSLYLENNCKNIIITGPNMAGKSTYMRQNALIVLLSHIGSFIPAESAIIPIMQKMLTRVGASDSLIEGKSTFFLELEELNTILHSASSSSFIIIDEIGRGTSTHDGIALAASIINFLLEYKNPYLLCSTHYHELKDIIINKKINWAFFDTVILKNGIKFLYKIKPGYANNSMGILLAKQIGFPTEIIEKAENYFDLLSENNMLSAPSIKNESNNIGENQINIEKIYKIVNNKHPEDISPREAHKIIELIYNIIQKK